MEHSCSEKLLLPVFLFVLSLCFVPVSAQERFKPGMVLFESGDTLFGEIAFARHDGIMDSVKIFPRDGGKQPLYAGTGDVLLVKWSDSWFIPAEVAVDTSYDNSYKLDRVSTIFTERRRIFLRQLIPGSRSLYHYKNKHGKDLFYIGHNGNYSLLHYKRYKLFNGKREVILENNTFREQLQAYLNCGYVPMKAMDTPYSETRLIELFREFYTCSENTAEYLMNYTGEQKLHIGFYSGVSFSTVTFKTINFPELKAADKLNSSYFTAGINFILRNPSFSNHHAFRMDLMYLNYTIQNDFRLSGYYYGIDLRQESIHLLALYQGETTVGNSLLYYNTGAFGSGIYRGYSRIDRFSSFGSEVLTASNRRMEFGAVAGGGIIHKSLNLELRYMIGNGIIVGEDPIAFTHRILILAGFQF